MSESPMLAEARHQGEMLRLYGERECHKMWQGIFANLDREHTKIEVVEDRTERRLNLVIRGFVGFQVLLGLFVIFLLCLPDAPR